MFPGGVNALAGNAGPTRATAAERRPSHKLRRRRTGPTVHDRPIDFDRTGDQVVYREQGCPLSSESKIAGSDTSTS